MGGSIFLGFYFYSMFVCCCQAALPPGVLNYMIAERYNQEPTRVASIVLIGNIGAIVWMPLALALAPPF